MDEDTLKKILEDGSAPPADENAKKRAVNLSVAAFQAQQQKKSKKFQGFSFFLRLTGKINPKDRRNPMETTRKKKFIYGGVATAMAVVLVAGVSLTQWQDTASRMEAHLEAENETAALQRVELDAAQEISAPPGTEKTAPAYSGKNTAQNGARIAEAYKSGASALPTPQEPPVGRLSIPQSNGAGAQAQRWRRLYEKAPAQRGLPPSKAHMEKDIASDDRSETKTASKISAEDQAYIDQATGPLEKWRRLRDIRLKHKEIGRDKFENFEINPVKVVAEEPVSTFSADVDTASYSFIRRQINNGVLPQKDAVRIEEMINYFDYNYPLPETREQPFKPTVAITPSPWAGGRKLMHIGIKGYDIENEKPRSNLVFLLDVSGSMNSPDKLPLVKNSMKMLLESLNPDDTIAIAVYAGAAGTVLEPTRVSEKGKIIAALERLNAGGSTAGAEGINLAYRLAEQNFDKEALNRVILATDGDFNVGITNDEELRDFVERKREKGVFLSVLGFGQGNYNDRMMQVLAQNGNGVAAYIDNLNEARKVLVEEASSSLFPIAKDVKLQVEFNPKTVAEYRLIGYETRHLNREDFNNDAVDAGDIGAGHTVTAIYEITPAGSESVSVDPLRYGSKARKTAVENEMSKEYAFLKIRYKLPGGDTSKLIKKPITKGDEIVEYSKLESTYRWQKDIQFATAVAAFGQILKGGQYTGDFGYDDVIGMANNAKGEDPFGYRAEFVQLVRLAKSADAMQPR
jgi:Ca-activated chloride channel family protein